MLLPVVVLPLLVASAMATSPVRPVHFGPGPVIPAPGVLGPVRPGPKTGPPSNEQTQKCGYNEEWAEDRIPCPPESCWTLYMQPPCAPPPPDRPPNPGCKCIDGYLRNDDNVCIPKAKCPPPLPKCPGPNEVARAKKIQCPPQTCESIYTTYNCEKTKEEPGCDCIDGFLRNATGICIPSEECPPASNQPEQCGPNEEFVADRPYCPVDKCFATPCAPVPPGSGPNPGCQCMDGYLRNNNNVCVPKDQCNAPSNGNQQPQPNPAPQPQQCGPNEEWVADRPYCPVDKCFAPPCAPVPPGSGPNPGCQCMDGYLRNNDNICVPKDQCNALSNENQQSQQQCGPNEVWVADSFTCPRENCYTLWFRTTCPPELMNRKPYPGCKCLGGYLRDTNKTCIPKEQCPPPWPQPSQPNPAPKPTPQPQQCGPNEEWVADRPYCPVDKCFAPPCAPVPPGSGPNPGCQCMDGYLRNNDNVCVPKDQCNALSIENQQPQRQCGPNEVWVADRITCPTENCYTLWFRTTCPPELLDRKPNPGCKCLDGYLRDTNHMCIPKEQCSLPQPQPQPGQCGPNEEWVADRPYCPVDKCFAPPCAPVPPGSGPNPGCICRNGYLRNNNNICVTRDQCNTQEPVCTGPNEEPTSDVYSCPPKTCSSLNMAFICLPDRRPPPQPGCQCIEGYFRNDNNVCVLPEQCPAQPQPQPGQCGPNEEWVADRPYCPVDNCFATPCAPVPPGSGPNPGCICRNGYLRNNNNTCVTRDQCNTQEPVCTGPNEEPTSDVYSCPPQTCSSLNMAFICLPDRRPSPQPGCKCMDGYFRNDNNVCVLPEQCPEPKPTESCPENEVWSAEKILCPPQSCASIYTSYNCLDVDVKKKAGCNCIDGYLRDDNDVCIPSDKCPGPKPICGYNEVYTDTKRTCPPESCAVATGLIAVRCADEVPQPGCVCKEGHARNSSDICIPIGQCPPGPLPICGDNEVYTDRKRTCPPQSCEAASGFIQYLCAYEEPKPGCICRDGYVRDKNEVCIPVAQCPPDSNPNEKEWECDSE